jgi:glutaredoxin 3
MYNAVELDQDAMGAAMQNYLAQKTGQRTVPNVFIGGKHLGGFDNVQAANADGSLKKRLNDAGIAVE